MVRLVTRRRWTTSVLFVTLMLVAVYWMLPQPSPYEQDLNHFRRSRDLVHYMDAINILIQPTNSCFGSIGLLVMVNSAPSNLIQRQTIRKTWGRHMTTYFVVGLGKGGDKGLIKSFSEAEEYNDLLVFDMTDHYQNLTIKTMMMLTWVQKRCPQAHFVFKCDDDVLVNPYVLNVVVKEKHDAELIGHRVTRIRPHRSEEQRWFLPSWLFPEDEIPEFLLGPGYLLQGKIIGEILEAAKNVPLINLEDVYWTYLVCKRTLNKELAHDRRVTAYFRPWLPMDCAYWTRATMDSFTPGEMERAWKGIMRKRKEAEGSDVCTWFENIMYYISFFVLIY